MRIVSALFRMVAAVASARTMITALAVLVLHPRAVAAESWTILPAAAVTSPGIATATPWWLWPLALFLFTILVGIIAVVTGVGGAVIFVPIIGSILPLNLDFIRGTGLMVALTGALYAGPSLLRIGLADLRLCLPMALLSSVASIAGAMVGLSLPAPIVQVALGVAILCIAVFMMTGKQHSRPHVPAPDRIAVLLGMAGSYRESTTGDRVDWTVHRTGWGLFSFVFIGFAAGMFGLGAGWANVPVLNMVLGAPLKVAVGSSKFILSITDTSAAWVYIHSGAVLPLITIPSILGMIIGTRVGVKLLANTKSDKIRIFVLVLLSLAGLMSLVKGIRAW